MRQSDVQDYPRPHSIGAQLSGMRTQSWICGNRYELVSQNWLRSVEFQINLTKFCHSVMTAFERDGADLLRGGRGVRGGEGSARLETAHGIREHLRKVRK